MCAPRRRRVRLPPRRGGRGRRRPRRLGGAGGGRVGARSPDARFGRLRSDRPRAARRGAVRARRWGRRRGRARSCASTSTSSTRPPHDHGHRVKAATPSAPRCPATRNYSTHAYRQLVDAVKRQVRVGASRASRAGRAGLRPEGRRRARPARAPRLRRRHSRRREQRDLLRARYIDTSSTSGARPAPVDRHGLPDERGIAACGWVRLCGARAVPATQRTTTAQLEVHVGATAPSRSSVAASRRSSSPRTTSRRTPARPGVMPDPTLSARTTSAISTTCGAWRRRRSTWS